MALIRPFLLSALIYLFFAVAYPDGGGSVYHAGALSAIAGGAVGLWFLRKILGLVEGAAHLVLEILFLAAVFAFVGWTMPQKSGKPPLQQWAEGARPTRDAARRGLDKLGVDPGGAVAARVVALFPK